MSTFLVGSKIWPFMAYCMYTKSSGPESVRTEKSRVIGLTLSGKEIEVDEELIGLNFFAYNGLYLRHMQRGREWAARQLAERLNSRRQDPIVSLRVETVEYRIVDQGLTTEEKEVTYRLRD